MNLPSGKPLDIAILLALLFVPSTRAIFKFLPVPAAVCAAMAVFLAFLYTLTLSRRSVSFFGSERFPNRRFIAFVILLFSAAAYFVYPIADARRESGMGSTADDAMIGSVRALVERGKPYAVSLAGSVPSSPGPGWIILNAPLVLSRCYFLLTPLYALFSILAHGRTCGGGAAVPSVMLALLSSSLLFWEMMVTGHDLIALGFGFATAVMLWRHAIDKARKGPFALWLLSVALLTGFLSTARIVFIFLPFLLGLLFVRRSPGRTMAMVAVSFASAAALHAIFYFGGDGYYQPLHLIGRGTRTVGILLIAPGAAATLALAAVAAFRVGDTLESQLGWFSLALAVPLSLIATGEFVSFGCDVRYWEGANYLMPVIPAFLWYAALKYHGERISRCQTGLGTPAGKK